jgi:hypothetical protein
MPILLPKALMPQEKSLAIKHLMLIKVGVLIFIRDIRPKVVLSVLFGRLT